MTNSRIGRNFFPMNVAPPISSLYVHVPFCAHKCEYCAFYSHLPNRELSDRYVSALLAELEPIAHDLKPATIFFGGGTPTLLALDQWKTILDAFSRLGLVGAAEWTVECNPASLSLDKAKLLRSYGVNRISMGAQSFDEQLLDRLGRIHSREMVFKSFDLLRKAGFDNLNIDLMFGIPGQTMQTWRKTLDEAMALNPEHLSCYEVIYEEDTPLFAQLQAGEFSVDEELACDMYEALIERAATSGFAQYEIANFAKSASNDLIPSRACRHNLNYWRGGSFYSIGPSATSYVRGVRTKNISNTTVYCDQLERGALPIDWQEELSPLARAGETAAFGLRVVAGWPFRVFQETTGFDLRETWKEEIDHLTRDDFARLTEDRFYLTERGLRLADWAGEQFLRSGN